MSEQSNWIRPFAFQQYEEASTSRWPSRWWLHLFLLLVTVATTTVFGSVITEGFIHNQPFNVDLMWDGYVRLAHGDPSLLAGLSFSLPLILILLTHEFGHYVACMKWGVKASLPYFMPSPTLLGTLGAFIRIRSPIYTRKSLFDIGVSGPIAGFVALLPVLVLGVALSRVVPGVAVKGDFNFGTPLILRLAEMARFPGVSADDISLHPVARAAWAGLLATAINLLPIGQLDGGHILYAFFSKIHRTLSRVFAALLLPLGLLFYKPWILWAVVLFFLGTRHPLIYDRTPLDPRRVKLGIAALVIFFLSFSLVPVRW